MSIRKKKIQFILGLAEMFGTKMTETRLEIYIDALNDITLEELTKSYNGIIKDPWIKKMPLPAEIRAAARPTLSPRDEAIRRLNMIKEAIRKFGWCSPVEAKNWLGDVWNDVRNMGGWMHICSEPSCNLNDPTIYAQKRDEVKSFVESNRYGITDAQIANPDKKQIGDKQKVLDFVSKTSERMNDA